jgi:two-component system NtrC family response regulator
MTEAAILLVEDDPAQRDLVADVLGRAGFTVGVADGLQTALLALADPALQLVLSDYKLADGDGLALLREVRARRPELSFVLVTAYGSIEHAVSAIRAGADDYLAKPFERQALLLAVDKALRTRALREENRKLADAIAERERLVDLIGTATAANAPTVIATITAVTSTRLIASPSSSPPVRAAD